MRCIWRIGWANVQWWGALFTAVGLTNGKIDGGAARTDGGEGELCGTSATRRRADTADAKNAESALPENGGSAKNGEASWGAMARERKLTTEIGEPLCPSRQIFDKTWGCFGGTRKVVGRKRGEMDKTWDVLTEKRGKNAQNGGDLGHRKVVLNDPRAVGEKRRAEGVRRGREFTIKPGERHKKIPVLARERGGRGTTLRGTSSGMCDRLVVAGSGQIPVLLIEQLAEERTGLGGLLVGQEVEIAT